ncbi:MAG: hypothetical protein JWR51_2505 [Devosia sp.]|uniref:hypothetical protein n=1 Tax=Devosia sp. TaxID=1871048 RepID=UPI0026377F3C|nr:hypothetical protein [Devosia sp.]MDB5529402.1 hypothetical protein [Devosia sp.]
MAWYTVSYDRLFDALRSAVEFCKPLQSIWIIDTPLLPSQVIAVLLDVGVLDDNDGIIVLEITGVGNYRRVINQTVADWLDGHLTKQ